MKHSKTFLLLLVAIFAIGNVYAYEQKGYVKTIGRPGKKGQRIANVSIYPKEGQGNSTNSDVNGNFSLPIKSKSFYINKITKTGYEPADADLLSTQFVCSANPLIILLANSAELREERNKVSRALYEELEQKFKKQQEKLDKLLNEKKISEEEYREELNLLHSKYDKNDALVREMAEKYSKLDFDQLNYFDQKVSELIMNGNLIEADSILRTKGDINQRRKELDALNAANDEVRNNLEKSEAVAKVQTDELATDYFHHFEICKLSLEFDSATYYIKERASLYNSTNIDFLSDAGDFLREYVCDYDQAQEYFEKALKQAKLQFGENSIETAKIYNKFATVKRCQDKYDEAIDYYNKAVNIYTLISSNEDLNLANCYNNMSIVYLEIGKFDEALKYGEKALEIKKSIVNENSKELAIAYNTIGNIYLEQNEFPKALEYINNAIKIGLSALGTDNITIAGYYYNVALIYNLLEKYNESIEYALKAKEIFISKNGEGHPNVAMIYSIIANNYSEQGKFDEALELHFKALNIRLSKFGNNSTNVASSYINIGNLYTDLKRYDEAIDMLKNALNIYEFIYGNTHPYVASSYYNIANCYNEMQDFENAINYHNKALDIRLEYYSDNHNNIANSYNAIGFVYASSQNFEKAIENYLKAIQYSENSPNIINYYNNIASAYEKQENFEKAAEYYFKCLDAIEIHLGKQHNHAITIYTNLAFCHYYQYKFQETIDLFNKAKELVLTLYGPEDSRVAKFDNLINIVTEELQEQQ